MITVEVNDKEYNLEEKDAALIETIQELTRQIRRLVDINGR